MLRPTSVLLPEPDGPTRAVVVPAGAASDTLENGCARLVGEVDVLELRE